MRTAKLTIGLAAGLFALAVQAGGSHAADYTLWPGETPDNFYGGPNTGSFQQIEILTSTDSDATADGTVFTAKDNPTNPSSGTGVFQPFKRVQRSTGGCGSSAGDCASIVNAGGGATTIDLSGQDFRIQNGFNTDAGESTPINFDMKNGSMWTRSVTMSEFDFGTSGYVELLLDANQIGAAGSKGNRLIITDMQIFIAPNLDNPELIGGGVENTGYTGQIYDPEFNSLLGNLPVWQLDSGANGNVDVLLQASICKCPGQGGSGQGDLSVFVPTDSFGSYGDDWNFVLYTEYMYVNDGFEEWSFRDAPGTQVSEPGSLVVFGFGLAGLGFYRRRRAAA